jgi:hypothetical protein
MCLIVTAVGCGPRNNRLPISGQVTLNGTPLDKGAIRFSSVGGEKHYATGGLIKDGEYKIPQEKGVPPGTYHVEINSPDTKAPPVVVRAAPGEPLGPPSAPDRIPTEYNTESKKTVDVTSDKKNEFDFNIAAARSKQ